MQTGFRALVQSEYGVPEKVLRIAKRPALPHGTGIPETSGQSQIATVLISDGWKWNARCTLMNRSEREIDDAKD